MSEKKKILFCVLNWGLGHATRSLPIIKYLCEQGHEVSIASDGLALQYLQNECSELIFHTIQGYDINYADTRLIIGMLRQGPKILQSIRIENKQVRSIVSELQIDLIISDSRFGCYDVNIPSYLIGHTLQIPLSDPITKFVSNRMLCKWINRFDRCWIPDVNPPENLSGYLSNARVNIPKDYVGWLTNLKSRSTNLKYRLVAVLSGPEPLRTSFEKKIIGQLANMDGPFLVIGGTPTSSASHNLPSHIDYVPIADGMVLSEYVSRTNVILGRSGYSSLMDWLFLKKKMIVIPTPGQPEQIYLAQLLKKRNLAVAQSQNQLDIESAMNDLNKLTLPNFSQDHFALFKKVVGELI